jgi:hypothetical protein
MAEISDNEKIGGATHVPDAPLHESHPPEKVTISKCLLPLLIFVTFEAFNVAMTCFEICHESSEIFAPLALGTCLQSPGS